MIAISKKEVLCVLGLFIITDFTYGWDDSHLDVQWLKEYLHDRALVRRAYGTKSEDDVWPGRWFPDKVTESPPKGFYAEGHIHHMYANIDSSCDDGKTNLTVDWPDSPGNYTCFDPKHRFEPDLSLRPLIIREAIPKYYRARHVCMDRTIEYATPLPTFGTHRPAWARYGEYKFLPRQRWLHNLEHGGVALLYHPCAHPVLVNRMKALVKSCLYRHVITPYTLLPYNRPIALVAWGWALLMSDVNLNIASDFIMTQALKGPEQITEDGQYDHMLIEPAKVISNPEDSLLCPLV